jgi:hypothetical protein
VSVRNLTGARSTHPVAFLEIDFRLVLAFVFRQNTIPLKHHGPAHSNILGNVFVIVDFLAERLSASSVHAECSSQTRSQTIHAPP